MNIDEIRARAAISRSIVNLREWVAALLDANAALEAERDKAVTALALIESNERGESHSAGVAMSALASIEEQT